MGAPKYAGRTCIGCLAHPTCARPATHPLQRCERCWRWARYHDRRDDYRAQVRERQRAYYRRRAERAQAGGSERPERPPERPTRGKSVAPGRARR